MTTVLHSFYPPIVGQERLESLLILDAPEEFVPTPVWNAVHAEVQRILGDLDNEVRRRVPQAVVMGGRTTGPAFQLFSYRTFCVPETPELDAVVAGITFSRKGRQVVVQGDASGEERGDLIETVREETCGISREQLVETARKVAAHLRSGGSKIAGALMDPSRRVE